MVNDPRGLASWVMVSAAIVGIAHLTLAFQSWRLARALARGNLKGGPSGLQALGWTTLAACVPGIVFVFPPILVFITGGVLIPIVFTMARFVAQRECEQLRPQR